MEEICVLNHISYMDSFCCLFFYFTRKSKPPGMRSYMSGKMLWYHTTRRLTWTKRIQSSSWAECAAWRPWENGMSVVKFVVSSVGLQQFVQISVPDFRSQIHWQLNFPKQHIEVEPLFVMFADCIQFILTHSALGFLI